MAEKHKQSAGDAAPESTEPEAPDSAEAGTQGYEAAAGAVMPDQAQDTEEGLVDLSSIETAEELSPDEDPVTLLEGEVASLKDQLLRAMAETENVRNRARREREESVKYAAAPLIKDLLAVADNLQRALASVPPEAAEENEALRNLLTGVEMTDKELRSVLEGHKIVTIDPMDKKLDPHFHEALFEVPDTGKPAGTVVQVIQVGYRLHDRLLRPARVGIAKAPTEEAAAAPAAQGAGNGLDPND
jgi:molecular chaperone GrpE